ncbi:hypothetical protein K490DRAFT_63675 [Saccharata proteae CBS 121410]|uniref:Uncharacterized protein n=1 Tax=Saccharata proteae CBS 121410 TaxID=1314787 RepID=A0A6A5YDI2_9PEZI|nr:hypothetical protein K490DRAFT_63675 [Saccharata proteae CBS 121410]
MIRRVGRGVRPGSWRLSGTPTSESIRAAFPRASSVYAPWVKPDQQKQREELDPSENWHTTDRRRPEHRPNTGIAEQDVYVVTVDFSPSLFQVIDNLRNKHVGSTWTKSNLVLFHTLPGSQLRTIIEDLEGVCHLTWIFNIGTASPFLAPAGLGLNVGRGRQNIEKVRQQLSDQWYGFLSDQDRRDWRPHWTLMSKVRRFEAEVVYDMLQMKPPVAQGIARGLVLWKFEYRRWTMQHKFWFKWRGLGAPTFKG